MKLAELLVKLKAKRLKWNEVFLEWKTMSQPLQMIQEELHPNYRTSGSSTTRTLHGLTVSLNNNQAKLKKSGVR